MKLSRLMSTGAGLVSGLLAGGQPGLLRECCFRGEDTENVWEEGHFEGQPADPLGSH